MDLAGYQVPFSKGYHYYYPYYSAAAGKPFTSAVVFEDLTEDVRGMVRDLADEHQMPIKTVVDRLCRKALGRPVDSLDAALETSLHGDD